MKVAELFVELGVKGTDTTVKALSSVADTAKGGIAAFKGLTAQSTFMGMALTQFRNFSELSTQSLQDWQYMLLQAGTSVGETTSNILSLQNALAQVELSHGAPEGLLAIANVVKDFDLNRLHDTFYMLGKIREYVTLTKGKNIPGPVHTFLSSLGLSPDFMQGLAGTTGLKLGAPTAHKYTEGQISGLTEAQRGWLNIKDKWEHGVGKEVAKVAPSVMKDLNNITTSLIQLMDAFVEFAIKIHALKGINAVFSGLGQLFKGLTDLITAFSSAHGREDIAKNVKSYATSPLQFGKDLTDSLTESIANAIGMNLKTGNPGPPPVEAHIVINGVETNNASAIGAAVGVEFGKIVNEAFRQLPNGGVPQGH